MRLIRELGLQKARGRR